MSRSKLEARRSKRSVDRGIDRPSEVLLSYLAKAVRKASELRSGVVRGAAALRHGEVRPLVIARRRARDLALVASKRALPGALSAGTIRRPYASMPVEHFDAHQTLTDGESTISLALEGGGVEFLRSPRGNGARARLVIASTDTVRAAAAIAASNSGGQLQMVGLDGRGRSGRRVSPADVHQLSNLLNSGGARLFSPTCSLEGLPLGGDELGCDLEVWAVAAGASGGLVAPWPNAWADSISKEQWRDANRRADHRPEEVSSRNLFDVAEPIDIVYTWVDGADPDWQKRKATAMNHAGGDLHETATNWSRFESNQELKYSLRSIAMYASWVRKIFIVTDRQCPSWLDITNPQITVVDHSEIFPTDAALPTFNSHAIESRLHHIEGLSERYVYFNDDVFLGRMVNPELFFEANGIARFFPSTGALGLGPPTSADLPVVSAGKQNRQIIQRDFNATVTGKFKHAPHSQQRTVLLELERRHSDVFQTLANSTFRNADDVSVASALQHLYAYGLGKAVPVNHDYFYLDIADSQAQRHLNGLLRTKSFDFFCLNSVASSSALREKQSELLHNFLERYFPVVSPYELTD